MRFRKNKCPGCGDKIRDLFMDFDAGTLHCAQCKSKLDPSQVITNWTVEYFAKLIPEEHRDAYLAKLGFERLPVRRTSPLVLGFLIGVIVMGVAMAAFTLWGYPSRVIPTALVGIVFISVIIGYCRKEKEPRWSKKRGGGGGEGGGEGGSNAGEETHKLDGPQTTRMEEEAGRESENTCPVCGYDGLYEPPRSPSGGGSYEICPSCGFQFGVTDDDRGIDYATWREQWIANGTRWNGIGRQPPSGWDPAEQLTRARDSNDH